MKIGRDNFQRIERQARPSGHDRGHVLLNACGAKYEIRRFLCMISRRKLSTGTDVSGCAAVEGHVFGS